VLPDLRRILVRNADSACNDLENPFHEMLLATVEKSESILICGNLLLPTPAKCLIKLHETLIFIPSSLRQSEFRGKQRPLAVQHFQISGGTALVAHVGEADRLVQVCYELLLLNSHLMEFLVSDQGIGYISEGALNGLLVGQQSLLVLRFGEVQISSKGASREDGLTYLSAVGPNSCVGTHQARESAATSKSAAPGARQRDLWKKLSLGNTNLSIRGDEDLLSLTNIGPTLEQRGRQAWGHFGRKRLLLQRPPARHACWVIAEENIDCIFLLANLSLEIRDRRVCAVENLLGLKHI
jgi:hypothetical protein